MPDDGWIMLVLRLYSCSGLRFYLFFPEPLWPSEFLCNRLHHVCFLLTKKTVDRIQQVCLRITSCGRRMLAVVQLGRTASWLALEPLLAATACKLAVKSCLCGSAPLAVAAAYFSSLEMLMPLWCLSLRLFKMNHLDTYRKTNTKTLGDTQKMSSLWHASKLWFMSPIIFFFFFFKKEITLITAVSSCWTHFARHWWDSLFFNVQRADVAVPAHFTPTKWGNRSSDRVHYKCQMRKRPNGPEWRSSDASVDTFGSELKPPRDAVMNESYTCSTLTPA